MGFAVTSTFWLAGIGFGDVGTEIVWASSQKRFSRIENSEITCSMFNSIALLAPKYRHRQGWAHNHPRLPPK